jgi:hypothetical protein
MLKHPDRNRALEFLIERVRQSRSQRPSLNYMQALGMAGDRRATAVIRPYFDEYLKAMEAESVQGCLKTYLSARFLTTHSWRSQGTSSKLKVRENTSRQSVIISITPMNKYVGGQKMH